MRETSPQVRLIMQPKLNWGEISDYLKGIGAEAWLDRVSKRAIDPYHLTTAYQFKHGCIEY